MKWEDSYLFNKAYLKYNKFKALIFAYKTTSGSAPFYLNSVLQTYIAL